jgi:N-acetylglucosamine-6-sulfatase
MTTEKRRSPRMTLPTRALAAALGVAAAAAGVSGGGLDRVVAAGAAARKPPPNIVLIVTDDQRWDTMGVMPRVRHQVGRKGVTFKNGFVVNSLCCPSRASILTGNYSHSTGVYTNRAPTGGFSAFDDDATLPVWLDRAGYRTGFVGKYLNGYGAPSIDYVPPGWDHWVAYAGSRDRQVYYDYRLSVNGERKKKGTKTNHYSTDVYKRFAARFVKDSNKPFFLMFTPNAPHRPYTFAKRHRGTLDDLPPFDPPSFNEKNVSDKPLWLQDVSRLSPEKRRGVRRQRLHQLRTLLAVDQAVGKILAILRDQHELRRTVVIFTSDNGMLWGEHRWRQKHVAYEEAIRIPLMIKAPGGARGRKSDALALNIDLAETIADYAGVNHPNREGRSLRRLVNNPKADFRNSFLIEHLQEPGHEKPPTYCAVRNNDYTYTAYETGEEELYDLNADPFQLENVAGKPAYAKVLINLRLNMMEKCDPPPPGFDPGIVSKG